MNNNKYNDFVEPRISFQGIMIPWEEFPRYIFELEMFGAGAAQKLLKSRLAQKVKIVITPNQTTWTRRAVEEIKNNWKGDEVGND